MMIENVDTTVQDWASRFIEVANNINNLTLPPSTSPEQLAKYVSALANENGGHILLGAYSHEHYGSGFQSVDSEVVERCKQLLEGVELEYSSHVARFQKIHLLRIPKSASLAFADGSAYLMENGKPKLIDKVQLMKKLGLGIDSSFINMLSEQITKQSEKLDFLSNELREKRKIKNQVPGLLVGAIMGWILSTILNKVFNITG